MVFGDSKHICLYTYVSGEHFVVYKQCVPTFSRSAYAARRRMATLEGDGLILSSELFSHLHPAFLLDAFKAVLDALQLQSAQVVVIFLPLLVKHLIADVVVGGPGVGWEEVVALWNDGHGRLTRCVSLVRGSKGALVEL